MNGEQRYQQARTKARILGNRNLRQFLADELPYLPMRKDREFIIAEFDRLHDEIERLRGIVGRVAELPYFKNARIEALVRDAKDALALPSKDQK